MIHIVKVDVICEACEKEETTITVFWWDTEDEMNSYREYLAEGPKRGEDLLGDFMDVNTAVSLDVVSLAGKWIGYAPHTDKKTLRRCKMSQRAPKNDIIIGMLADAVKAELEKPSVTAHSESNPAQKKGGRDRGPRKMRKESA